MIWVYLFNCVFYVAVVETAVVSEQQKEAGELGLESHSFRTCILLGFCSLLEKSDPKH
jgi:hypothetical protein